MREKKKFLKLISGRERGKNLIMLFSDDEQTNSFAFYSGHIDREFIAKINWV
jgi:hypothetical protein